MQHKNFLEAFFYNEITPGEKRVDHGPEYEEREKTFICCEERLTACLNRGERELLAQFVDAKDDLDDFSLMDSFVEGFQLGAEFILDALVLPQKSVVHDIS